MSAAEERPGTTLVVPQGSFELLRYPDRPRLQLRAWDAADDYLLNEIADRALLDGAVERGAVVVLNDAFGALTVALAASLAGTDSDIVVVADRYTSRRAIEDNLTRNGIHLGAVTVSTPLDALPERIGTLVIRPPRSNELLAEQLRTARPGLTADSVVIGGAMVKHLHSSTLDVLIDELGPTTTTLARRKARLFDTTVDPPLAGAAASDSTWPRTDTMGPAGLPVVSHAGVFSAGRLDDGTAMLLANLPDIEPGDLVVDLGSGNGVIARHVLAQQPSARVVAVDDSALATASTRATLDGVAADVAPLVIDGNGLFDSGSPAAIERKSAALVLCNPPFHDDHALGDAIAWQMFNDASRALRPGGLLLVVGNRHLAYHAKLQRLFGNNTVVASDKRFVLVSAVAK